MSKIIKNPIVLSFMFIVKAFLLELKNRKKNLKILGVSKIINSKFGYRNTIYENSLLCNVHLGDFSYVGTGCKINNTIIGKFCSIGPDCKIGLGIHPSRNFVSSHPIFFSTLKQSQITFADQNYFKESEDILIENDVWIGANVTLIDGIKVGNGAIIGAGSVVTKDIPPYAIVGGVPAKIIKYRFKVVQIKRLQCIKWWDLDIKYIRDNFKLFHNIEEFIKNFKNDS